jgi:hypothetical protein
MWRRFLAFVPLVVGLASSLAFGQPKAKIASKPAAKFENFRVPTPIHARTTDAGFGSWAALGNLDQSLRDLAKGGPNFAGHFVVEGTTCGSLCHLFYIVDVKTGVIFKAGIVNTMCKNAGGPNYRLDSRLLVVSGQWESDHGHVLNPCGDYYYQWDGKRLKQIQFIAGDDYSDN